MHVLDLVMFIVLSVAYWLILPNDFTEEIGGVIGFLGYIIFTIFYVSIFVVGDLNWIDLFNNFNFKIQL